MRRMVTVGQMVLMRAQQCQVVAVLGDGAYINTGPVVPYRKRPGQPLLAGRKPTTRNIVRPVHGSSMRSAGCGTARSFTTSDSAATAATARSKPSRTGTTSS